MCPYGESDRPGTCAGGFTGLGGNEFAGYARAEKKDKTINQKLYMTRLTLNKWAVELGTEFRTLKKRLLAAGLEVKARQTFTTREIVDAWTGGIHASKARLLAAEARIRELELAEMEKKLMPWDEVQTVVRNGARSMRQRLDSLPSEAAHLCNPTDPEHARLALEGWVKAALPIIRETNARLDKEAGLK